MPTVLLIFFFFFDVIAALNNMLSNLSDRPHDFAVFVANYRLSPALLLLQCYQK